MNPRIVRIKQIREKVVGAQKGDDMGQDAPRSSNGDAPAQPVAAVHTGPNVSTGTGTGAEKSPGEYQNVY